MLQVALGLSWGGIGSTAPLVPSQVLPPPRQRVTALPSGENLEVTALQCKQHKPVTFGFSPEVALLALHPILSPMEASLEKQS